MRVILSRKGFDTASGGGPSPLLPDGRLVSLPIPEGRIRPTARTTYRRLQLDETDYAELLRSLYPGSSWDRAHLDPDLVSGHHGSPEGFRGLFGQAGAAAAHLARQGVRSGDLFLFFGRFRAAETDPGGSFRFANGAPDFHAIFGYLEVGEVIRDPAAAIARGEALAPQRWSPAFPHFLPTNRTRAALETVYVAASSFDGTGLPGFGVFRYRDELRLTSPTSTRPSRWALPACFDAAGLTYHPRTPARDWKRVGETVEVTAASRGQEFVCHASREVADWARRLVLESRRW